MKSAATGVVTFVEHGTHKTIGAVHGPVSGTIRVSDQATINYLREAFEKAGWEVDDKENRETGGGPSLDPDSMPPEELARLRAEGFGHMIGKSRMDDSPGYRRDW